MSRLDIKTPSKAQTVVDNLYRDVERRIAASPPGLCPVDMSLTFLQLCHAQSCGKCVPCRIGLGQLTKLIGQVLDGEATLATLAIIEKTARSIVNTADCAIGRDAARLVVDGLEGFREDYVEHIAHHRCLASLSLPVPCVALCRCGTLDPQGQSYAHILRLYLRASLRGPLPPRYDRCAAEYPGVEALCGGSRR